jgi:membrane protease YdiL (CAAX protease family)
MQYEVDESAPVEQVGPRRRSLSAILQRAIAEPLLKIQAESRAYSNSPEGQRPDGKVMIVLLTSAVCLALQQYVSLPAVLRPLVTLLAQVPSLEHLDASWDRVSEAATTPFGRWFHWSLVRVLTYFVLPSLVVRLVLREPVRNYGVKLRGAFAGLWLYSGMLIFMLPLVFLMSFDAHFQHQYPFYPLPRDDSFWPQFWAWELMYWCQFFALEFFFRGFMLHGLKHRFGAYAIFVMMVPYCMIHFGKPVQETFASIIAGIVLGFMSLKTRSIWMGAALHVSVALSMDLASLWQKGYFG